MGFFSPFPELIFTSLHGIRGEFSKQAFSTQISFIPSRLTGATVKQQDMLFPPMGSTTSLPTNSTFSSFILFSMSVLSVSSSPPLAFIFSTNVFPSTHWEKLALAPLSLNWKIDRSVRFSFNFHSSSPPVNSFTLKSGFPAPPRIIHLDPCTLPFMQVTTIVTVAFVDFPPNPFSTLLISSFPLLLMVSLWICSTVNLPGLFPAAPNNVILLFYICN